MQEAKIGNRNIMLQLQASILFVAPPYLWEVHSLGLVAISGFIGTVLAIFVGGKLIDMIANRMTERNHGRREPEYRLPALIIPAIIGPMGILLFGICAAEKTLWIGPAFGYGMQGFGLTAVSNVLVTYAVDSYFSVNY
jgi:MFS family permease